MFEAQHRGSELIARLKGIVSDGLLVSKEVVPNPEFYRRLRVALESRSVYVPSLVQDRNSGSFVAKRVIAAIWSDQAERVHRDSLLLEYHNIRQEVVNANKDFLQRRYTPSPSLQLHAPSASP